MDPSVYQVWVCRGPECAGRRAADDVHRRLVTLIDERQLASRVVVDRQSCFGRCRHGPNVYVRPVRRAAAIAGPSVWVSAVSQSTPVDSSLPAQPSALYHQVTESDIGDIIERHIIGHAVIHDLTRRRSDSGLASRTGSPDTARDPDESSLKSPETGRTGE